MCIKDSLRLGCARLTNECMYMYMPIQRGTSVLVAFCCSTSHKQDYLQTGEVDARFKTKGPCSVRIALRRCPVVLVSKRELIER